MPAKGSAMPDAVRRKISATRRGMNLNFSAEHRERIRRALTGKPFTDERRRHVSEALKASWARRKEAVIIVKDPGH